MNLKGMRGPQGDEGSCVMSKSGEGHVEHDLRLWGHFTNGTSIGGRIPFTTEITDWIEEKWRKNFGHEIKDCWKYDNWRGLKFYPDAIPKNIIWTKQ